MQGPRGIGSAVVVLGARVAEVYLLGIDGGAVAFFGFIVDDGGVGAGGGDGVEGEADKVLVFARGGVRIISFFSDFY